MRVGGGGALTHVFLEIFAHVGVGNFDVDAGGCENFWIADPGDFEQLGGLNATAADDDFVFCFYGVF